MSFANISNFYSICQVNFAIMPSLKSLAFVFFVAMACQSLCFGRIICPAADDESKNSKYDSFLEWICRRAEMAKTTQPEQVDNDDVFSSSLSAGEMNTLILRKAAPSKRTLKPELPDHVIPAAVAIVAAESPAGSGPRASHLLLASSDPVCEKRVVRGQIRTCCIKRKSPQSSVTYWSCS